jgi:hypothetical protein
MLTHIRTPISNRRRAAVAYVLAGTVLAVVAALPIRAQNRPAPPSVTAVAPDGALPGDPVAISGSGFGSAPEALFCWSDTGDGGFAFAVEAAADSRIEAVVGEVPSAVTGAVKVWRGKRYPLADRVALGQGRLFSASDGEVFVRHAGALGPDFSSFGGSPGTFGSVTVQGELRLDLKDLDGSGGGQQRVRVTAVIETSEDSDNNDTSTGNLVLRSGGQSAGPAWAATTTVETDAAPRTPEAFAAGLAEVLESQLGSLGLTARVEGTELVLGHAQGIRAGFVGLVDLTGE